MEHNQEGMAKTDNPQNLQSWYQQLGRADNSISIVFVTWSSVMVDVDFDLFWGNLGVDNLKVGSLHPTLI